MNRTVNKAEAAKFYGCSLRTIDRMLASGELKRAPNARRLDRTVRIVLPKKGKP